MPYSIRPVAIAASALILVAFLPTTHAAGQSPPDTKGFRPSYDTCIKASRGVTVTLNSCIGAERDYQDKRLNAAYQNLRKAMSDVQRNALRDEERAWITTRDKECESGEQGGTADLLDANQCRLDKIADRAAELEARNRQ